MLWYRFVHRVDKDDACFSDVHRANCQSRLNDRTGHVRYRAKCSCKWTNTNWYDTHDEAEKAWHEFHILKLNENTVKQFKTIINDGFKS